MKKIILTLSLLCLVVMVVNAQSTVVTAIPSGLTVAKLAGVITLPDSLAVKLSIKDSAKYATPHRVGLIEATLAAGTELSGLVPLLADSTKSSAGNYVTHNQLETAKALKVNAADSSSTLGKKYATGKMLNDGLALKANLNNPTFTSLVIPSATTATTQTALDNSTKLSTTAYVDALKSATATLTNKRWTARVGNTTSSATPTINTNNVDIYKLTAQTADITSMSSGLSGAPVDGDILEIQVTGTAARAITWGTSFVSSTVTLPTTTVTTATLTVVFQYFATSSYGNTKWVCVNTF